MVLWFSTFAGKSDPWRLFEGVLPHESCGRQTKPYCYYSWNMLGFFNAFWIIDNKNSISVSIHCWEITFQRECISISDTVYTLYEFIDLIYMLFLYTLWIMQNSRSAFVYSATYFFGIPKFILTTCLHLSIICGVLSLFSLVIVFSNIHWTHNLYIYI